MTTTRSSAADAAARELLISVFQNGWVGGVALDAADADAEHVNAAVVDAVLVAAGVRGACLFVLGTYGKKARNVAVLRACAALGLEATRLTDPQDARGRHGFETFFAFRRGDGRMGRVAAAHKACFGASVDEWPEERLRACGDAEKALGVDAWKDAGKAFGYLIPSPRDPDGGIDFFVTGLAATRINEVMGPQSVRLSDPRVGTYVRDRCRAAQRVLRRLVGDAFPNLYVQAQVYLH